MTDTTTREGAAAVTDLLERLLEQWAGESLQPNSPINLIEFLHEAGEADTLTIDDLETAPAEMEDDYPEVQDPLLEINVGTKAEPRPLFVSQLLDPELAAEIIGLLHEYKDCFAWDYHEMPGLPRSLVEHELKIKEGFWPFQQSPRRFSTEVQLKVKEEIERLLEAGFIRTARNVEWLANIVPVLKKTGALRICTDCRNLNLATPKNEYPMPMSDLLVDGAAKHELLSFMDGHAGYNQIFIAEEDVHKTAFRCPRFISNLAGKIRPLTPLLKLKDAERFVWETEHQAAFDDIKKYLSQPPVLMPPKRGKPLRLYISASKSSIGCLLAQNNESEREQAVHYLSRTLNMAELNYSPIEKLWLALYFAATKLRHYMLPLVVQIISSTDLIKYMLTRPIIHGRIGKWTMALSEFTFQYVAQKSVKGQALADFLAHHPTQGQEEETEVEIGMAHMEKNYWTMYFDGSSTKARSGAGVVIESPQGQRWQFAFQLDFRCTNNQAEYEALIIGLEILREMKATRVLVYGDSQLVINRLTGDYQCTSENLTLYYVTALNTADQFSRISFIHVPRTENHEANEMAQVASAEITDEVETADTDWRYPIVKYLRDPSGNHERTTRFRARCYLIYQNELYRKGSDGLLVLCPSAEEMEVIMTESHEGICGAHQSGIKMRWVPAEALHPVTKPWPFKGWAVDIIGKIYPAVSNQHAWILVATDYFTKWVEAESYRSISSAQVVRFFENHIVHRVGVPETIIGRNSGVRRKNGDQIGPLNTLLPPV
ncbi:unnamed protein product [Prunus brigantina]